MVHLRLTGPDDWGYIELVEAVQKWERRRPVTRELPPAIGQYHVDSQGRYGLTLLVPDENMATVVGELWAQSEGCTFEVGPVEQDPMEAAIDLKVEAEAGVFELVDSGDLTPDRARVILESEFGRRRTKFVGGFLKLVTVASLPSQDKSQPPSDDETVAEPVEASMFSEESALKQVAWAEHELAGTLMPDSFVEKLLRGVIAFATSRGFLTAKEAAEEVLRQIPEANFDCPLHTQCRLEETELRMKTRHLQKAVEYGRAAWDDTNGIYTWSAEDWPEWRSRTSPTESRTR